MQKALRIFAWLQLCQYVCSVPSDAVYRASRAAMTLRGSQSKFIFVVYLDDGPLRARELRNFLWSLQVTLAVRCSLPFLASRFLTRDYCRVAKILLISSAI